IERDIMENEEWKEIEGFPEYEVSSLGRVRSFWKRGCKPQITDSPRVLKPVDNGKGYLQVGLYLGGKVYKQLIHRLVCEAFHGEPPTPEHEVAHWDGDRSNNAVGNLRWATPAENMSDKKRHGT